MAMNERAVAFSSRDPLKDRSDPRPASVLHLGLIHQLFCVCNCAGLREISKVDDEVGMILNRPFSWQTFERYLQVQVGRVQDSRQR